MGRANVAGKGFVHVSLKDSVADRIAAFIETNEWGYRSRAEVVTAAVRRFLEQEGEPVVTLGALRAVASLNPTTVEELLDALMRELDVADHRRPLFRAKEGGVAHGAQAGASKGKSNSESTKRR